MKYIEVICAKLTMLILLLSCCFNRKRSNLLFESSTQKKLALKLRFKLTNRLIQSYLLNRKSIFCRDLQELSKVKKQLQGIPNNVDLAHLISLYLVLNDEREQKEIYDSKTISITKELNSNDPKKIIFNFFFFSLWNSVKLLLSKRLSFALPKNKTEYSNYLVNFEIMLKI